MQSEVACHITARSFAGLGNDEFDRVAAALGLDTTDFVSDGTGMVVYHPFRRGNASRHRKARSGGYMGLAVVCVSADTPTGAVEVASSRACGAGGQYTWNTRCLC